MATVLQRNGDLSILRVHIRRPERQASGQRNQDVQPLSVLPFTCWVNLYE